MAILNPAKECVNGSSADRKRTGLGKAATGKSVPAMSQAQEPSSHSTAEPLWMETCKPAAKRPKAIATSSDSTRTAAAADTLIFFFFFYRKKKKKTPPPKKKKKTKEGAEEEKERKKKKRRGGGGGDNEDSWW